MQAKCELQLDYYNTDDGIWLTCKTHNGQWNLGYWPSPDDVNDMVEQHTRAVTKSEG